MSHHAHLMNPGAMFANGSDPNQPSYNTNYGAQAPAPAPAHNGYPGYAPPPPSYGYYNPNHALQGGSAPPAQAPYGYYPPPPAYNNGYYDPRFYQAPVRRPAKPKTPGKPKAARSGSKNVSYKVAGNRISGNTGDHNGVFNVGNKNSGRHMDDDDEEDEY